MALTAGTRLGVYAITAQIGEGGMGQVYRARDTKLNREVALKVLPDSFANDPDRLARFTREAQTLASLNHPNIAHIHGIEESGGVRALVMELVEGDDLAQRIARGAIPIDEALPIATQIADAVEAAHEQGIIHRDLKPANIKVRPDGTVKVLDFGLAKAMEPAGAMSSNVSISPTITTPAMTQMGMILGTAAYMSPEQAAGKAVDKRADIWSFGVVVWEMLSGARLFSAETVPHTLADVLRAEIDFGKLPRDTPRAVRDLLKRCLIRDVKTRLRDIGEARIAISSAAKDPEAGVVTRGSLPRSVPWALASLFAIVAAALAVRYFGVTVEPPRTLKMSVMPPETTTLAAQPPALSPDGRRLAFVATTNGRDELWVRDLDSLGARPLRGTDGASYPFWSPDSRMVAFFADRKLKKVDVAGGSALSLADTGIAFGGSWSRNDVIMFASLSLNGLFRVPAAGGSAERVTQVAPGAEIAHRYPWFLPDGRHFLYQAATNDPEKTVVYVADIDSDASDRARRLVVSARSNCVYASPGYLLFVREQTLVAQPFDVDELRTTGDAVPIAEQVDYASTISRGLFSVSQEGVLAYVSGGVGENIQLSWFDRSGKVTGTLGAPGTLTWPAISPDGATVAVDRADPQTGLRDVWLYNLVTGTNPRFTFGPESNYFPVWSPDGSHLAFFSSRVSPGHVYQKSISGTARDEVLSQALADPPRHTRADDWSRDGRYLIEELANTGKMRGDIWVLPLFGDRKPFPYVQTEFNEHNARLAPSGHWLAYVSDETKRDEVYVQTFPVPGGKWQISTEGGSLPVWSRKGDELFFVGADRKLRVVEVRNGPSKTGAGNGVTGFEAGVPKVLFDTRLGGNPLSNAFTGFDVSQDGRFLIPTRIDQAATVPMTVVVNWAAALKK